MMSLEWSLKDFSPVIAVPNRLAPIPLPSYSIWKQRPRKTSYEIAF